MSTLLGGRRNTTLLASLHLLCVTQWFCQVWKTFFFFPAMHSVICFKASLANLWHVTEGQPWSRLCTRTPAAARSQARHKGRKVPQRRKENTASWKWSYMHFICRTCYVRTSCGTEAWLALPGQRAIGGTRLTSNRMESAKSCATKWQKNEFSKSGRYKKQLCPLSPNLGAMSCRVYQA